MARKGRHKPVITENHLPSILIIDALSRSRTNIIRNNLHRCILPHEFVQQRSNQWCHTPREDNNRDIVLLRPVMEIPESGIQLNSVEKSLGALVERGRDGVQHLLKGRAEGDLVGEDVLVQAETGLTAHAEVVSQVVVGVGGGDGAVEVGEEDEFWGGRHCWESGLAIFDAVGCHFDCNWCYSMVVEVLKWCWRSIFSLVWRGRSARVEG